MQKYVVIIVAFGIILAILLHVYEENNDPMTSWTFRISSLRSMGIVWSKLFSPSSAAGANPLSSNMLTNKKCRNSVYPRSEKKRFNVPDEFLKWETEFPDYAPVSYTYDGIRGQPWADPEKLPKDVYNNVDSHSKVDRKSHEGTYKVEDGVPLNPIGRTGIKGRGCLGRWGPNHAADPIVTRWKVDEKGEQVKNPETGKPILQFIAIQRKDSKEWAIPGGMVDPGEKVTATLKREFGEEALNSLELTKGSTHDMEKKLDDFFHNGIQIYQGYVDDPRNTDNAWMETVAYNFHDTDGSSVALFKLHAGDDAVGVKWLDIGNDVKLYASHADMIKKVADHHHAHW